MSVVTSNRISNPTREYTYAMWLSLSTAILTVIFIVATFLFSPTEWKGIASYIASYKANEIIVWIPCFLFALTYMMMITTIRATIDDNKIMFYRLAFVFSIVYGVIAFLNAYIQITVFRTNILAGSIEGLEKLALPNPHSITYALEGLGYSFLGLSTLFYAFTFNKGKLSSIIKVLLIINGIVGIIGLLISPFDMPILMLPGLGVWCIEYPILNILLFVYYRKRITEPT